MLPNTKAPLALTLKLNGYATAQFGKCHEVPVWQTSPAGPFTAWPTGGGGFEYFYGFIGGENNQWDPALYEGTTPIEPPKTPAEGYHLTEDLADKAIAWTRQQKALLPDKPFFMYFAPGATHAPHHVPKEWIDKYKGKFAHGWDKQREITFAKQKELGVIGANAELTPRHKEIPAWDAMDPKLKPVLEREMEVYAAFMEHTDHHVGRIIDALKDMEILDDTLIYLIIGDNGASAEGTLQGAFNEMANFNGMAAIETPEFMMSKLDEFGGEASYGHYAVGWAWAMNSPVPVDQAGRVALGRHAQRHDRALADGRSRKRAASAISSATSSTSRRRCSKRRGFPSRRRSTACMQSPYEGTSMLYSFNDAGAAERHETQYFEMFCNRGIYHKGWSAVTKHRTPWEMGGAKMPAFDDDVWELYDGNKDWTQAKNLAKEMPEKLHELQRLWLIEAVKFNVLPLDDRQIERFVPELAGRPALIKGNSQLLFAGMGRLSENSVVSIKNKSFAVTADIDVPAKGGRGRVHRAGRTIRRLEPLREGRQGQVRLQRARHQVVRGRKHRTDSGGQDAGAHGVRVRRRRQRQGRQRDALLRRQGSRQGPRRSDAGLRLLGRRDDRHRLRVRHDGEPGLHRAHQPVQRQDPLGADRSRQGRRGRGSLHLGGRTSPRRDGATVRRSGRGRPLAVTSSSPPKLLCAGCWYLSIRMDRVRWRAIRNRQPRLPDPRGKPEVMTKFLARCAIALLIDRRRRVLDATRGRRRIDPGYTRALRRAGRRTAVRHRHPFHRRPRQDGRSAA